MLSGEAGLAGWCEVCEGSWGGDCSGSSPSWCSAICFGQSKATLMFPSLVRRRLLLKDLQRRGLKYVEMNVGSLGVRMQFFVMNSKWAQLTPCIRRGRRFPRILLQVADDLAHDFFLDCPILSVDTNPP